MTESAGRVKCGESGVRLVFPLAMTGVAALHVLLVMYFVPPHLVFSSTPLAGADFEFHAVEISRFVEAVWKWGHTWAWDPQLLAGYPEGTIFDCDSKAFELFVYALHRIGVPMGLAFNLYILLAHVALPPVVYLSTRLLDGDRWTALAATLMASLLWHFDTTIHLTWWLGTVSYAAVGYAGLLPVASLHAFLRSCRAAHLLLLCISLSIVHLVHPFVFDEIVLPMVITYAVAFRTLDWRRHTGVALAVACTLIVNSWWLAVLYRFRGEIAHIDTPWQGTLHRLWIDLLGTPGRGSLGLWWGERTWLAILLVALAITGLVRWRKARDDRFLPFAAGIAAMIAAAYLGELVPGLEQTQSYRHIIPAMMLSVIPAASLTVDGIREWRRSLPNGLARQALILAGALVALLTIREILSFFPPAPSDPPSPSQDAKVLGPTGECLSTPPRHLRFRHAPRPRGFDIVAERVGRWDPKEGRILIESWDLAEHIAWTTRAQVMGGFPYRNVRHSEANPTKRMAPNGFDVEDFERYLVEYAVRWVIFSRPHPELSTLLERKGFVVGEPQRASCAYQLYRTRVDVSFFSENRGDVDASLNRLDVRHTDPSQDVVLRYHFANTFECRPGCSIRPEPVPGDPVGFIRVESPHPADFSLVNAY
ncbi:MAG: hypothetical protein PHU25_14640 [Deltaproteobacteria bacterium]|nr:hypothetical protein [Deltaproteobacteria bacterium]